MRIDSPSVEIVHAQARRDRADMIYRLLIAPVIRFFLRRGQSAPRTAPLRSRLA
jgi:hypothetical protein